MTNDLTRLHTRIADLHSRAQLTRHRYLLVIETDAAAGAATPAALLDAIATCLPAASDCPWIDAEDAPHHVTPRRARSLLGQSLNGVVIDARQQLDADSLGIASGALRGGALLVLITPSLHSWLQGPSRFLRRIAQRLLQDPDLVRWPHGSRTAAPEPLARPAEPARQADPECATADQARAVDAVLRVIKGRARRPLVLQADRGRGKSAALGIAAARALLNGHGPILVTAPARSAVDALWQHASRILTAHDAGALLTQLQFVAPDALTHAAAFTDPAYPARALLVDEAAALPAPLLAQLLAQYSRVAFATTVHGYEGTGRSFDVRFRPVLQAQMPEARELRMRAPIRHADDDPLERLVFDALLLDAEPAPSTPAAQTALRIEAIDRDALLGDEVLLRQLFGLLVLAHYRTRPRDLQRLLDDPRVHLHGAWRDAVLVGVVQSIDEGGLPAELAAAVAAGQRRPAGHLSAEIIAGQLGVAAGARLRSRRIMRIVSHPLAQRQGIGQALVEAVAEHARQDNVELLSVSFGMTAALLRFWRACGAVPVRAGLRRDAASGEHAVLVLRALHDDGQALLTRLRGGLARQVVDQCGDALADVEDALLPELLAGLQTPDAEACNDADRTATERWVAALCPLEEVPGAVRRLLLWLHRDHAPDHPLWPVLLARSLQGLSWPDTARRLGATGRAEAEAALRTALGEMLSEAMSQVSQHNPPETPQAD